MLEAWKYWLFLDVTGASGAPEKTVTFSAAEWLKQNVDKVLFWVGYHQNCYSVF